MFLMHNAVVDGTLPELEVAAEVAAFPEDEVALASARALAAVAPLALAFADDRRLPPLFLPPSTRGCFCLRGNLVVATASVAMVDESMVRGGGAALTVAGASSDMDASALAVGETTGGTGVSAAVDVAAAAGTDLGADVTTTGTAAATAAAADADLAMA